MVSRIGLAIAAAAVLGGGAAARAFTTDTSALGVFLTPTVATGGGILGSFTYDEANDRAYVVTFGASASLRIIDDVTAPPASQSVTIAVSNAQWQLFTRNGDSTLSGQAIPSGILLNPYDIALPGGGVIAAGSEAIIIDAGADPSSGTGSGKVTYPDLGNRLYSYNLQVVQPNPDPTVIPTSAPYYDGRDVFTPLLTTADYKMAAGYASNTSATTNLGRQFAWSSDGQGVYFNDTSSSFGGIWRMSAATGALTKIVDETSTTGTRINTEPSVQTLNATTDRIFFEGSTSYGNIGGVNYVDYNSSTGTASSVGSFVNSADLSNFLNTAATVSVTATAYENHSPANADGGGDLYFWGNNGASGDDLRRVLLRRDDQGNLWKVMTYQERLDFANANGISKINANVLRIQTRQTTLNGSPIEQLLFAEPSSGNYIASVYVYKPADFSHDNRVNSSDVADLRSVITSPTSAQSNFDLNGDNSFTFTDVQLGLKALDFGIGDVNLDGVVDYNDYEIFDAHLYDATPDISGFLEGDLNDDGVVNYADYVLLKDSYEDVSAVLPPTGPVDFRPLPAFIGVPEPASLGLFFFGAAMLAVRRRGARGTR